MHGCWRTRRRLGWSGPPKAITKAPRPAASPAGKEEEERRNRQSGQSRITGSTRPGTAGGTGRGRVGAGQSGEQVSKPRGRRGTDRAALGGRAGEGIAALLPEPLVGGLLPLAAEGSRSLLAALADKVEDESGDGDGGGDADDGLAGVGLEGLTRAVRAKGDVVGGLLFVERELLPVLLLELLEVLERLLLLCRGQRLPRRLDLRGFAGGVVRRVVGRRAKVCDGGRWAIRRRWKRVQVPRYTTATARRGRGRETQERA